MMILESVAVSVFMLCESRLIVAVCWHSSLIAFTLVTYSLSSIAIGTYSRLTHLKV